MDSFSRDTHAHTHPPGSRERERKKLRNAVALATDGIKTQTIFFDKPLKNPGHRVVHPSPQRNEMVIHTQY